jgi:pilus assembly protein Flp/PilA
MKEFWIRLWRETAGQDLIEYALAAGLMAVAAVAAIPTLNTPVSQIFARISSVVATSIH